MKYGLMESLETLLRPLGEGDRAGGAGAGAGTGGQHVGAMLDVPVCWLYLYAAPV